MQSSSKAIFSSKASDRTSSINFFSPEKIYKSISTIQDKYPNLKIDPKHVVKEQTRPAQTTKKEQINLGRIEGIISPSR